MPMTDHQTGQNAYLPWSKGLWRCIVTSRDKWHNFFPIPQYQTCQAGDLSCGLLPVKLYTFSLVVYNIKWQTENIISLLLIQCLWPPTWQRSGKQWGAPTHKVTWSFIYKILWGHLINYTSYIFSPTKPMATKHEKVMIYCKRDAPVKHHSILHIWSGEGKGTLMQIWKSANFFVFTRT